MMRKRFTLSRSAFLLCLVLGFAGFVFLGHFFRLFEEQELGFLDLRFRLRGGKAPHPDLVIVEMDDASISRIGQWPWPRSYHATLLNVLSSYHPRLILYDVLFTEAGPNPNEDALLQYAIEEAGNVILPFFFHSEHTFLAFFPIEPLRHAARGLGYANIFPDRDGVTRRIQRSMGPQEAPYYHTSVLTALTTFRDEEQSRRWLDQIFVDRENSFLIDYPGDYSRFLRIPFYQLIEKEGKKDPELQRLLEDKIVLVGMTATGSGDARPTPFSSIYPGVGIQASALHTLLKGRFLRRFDGPVLFGFLLTLTLLVTFITRKYSPRVGIVAVLILTAFYLIWNFLVFDFLGWVLPITPILLVLLGTYVLVLFVQYVQVRFEGELMGRELSLAARIQENFLPQQSPRMDGVEVAFQCQFARVVGGDLYDWLMLGERRLGICVGDVAGKGVPAALYMARAISEFRALAMNFNSTSTLLEALNSRLVPASGQGIFVTFLYLILDLDSKSIFLSNAGHEPLLVYRGRTGESKWIREGQGQPLGLFLDTHYGEQTLSFEEGDFLVLISDGVRELRSPAGQEFGLERVEKALDAFPRESAEGIVRHFFRAMDEFSKGSHAHDDRTVLCLKLGSRF